MATDTSVYDFIIVGGGTAGCVIASDLARSKAAPSVLLVEAGGDNADPAWRDHANMTTQTRNAAQNWGYKSEPMASANGRELALDRGKGLGGCTAINYTYWTRGSRDEFDEMARLTGDDAWRWDEAARRYRELENHHFDAGTDGLADYYNPAPGSYGEGGPIHISRSMSDWRQEMVETADVWEARGYPRNVDMSGGNPIGLIVSPLSGYRGVRSTSADLLVGAPANLRVMTDAPVHGILVHEGRAIGIRLAGGEAFAAAREVILAAGAVDSPKILLLSGIGPAGPLAKLGVPLVRENAHVGQNLRDHYHVSMLFVAHPGSVSQAGVWHKAHAMGWFKSAAALASREFAELPADVRRRLELPTVGTWEMVHRGADDVPGMGKAAVATVFVMNSESRGSVALRSADPAAPPLIRPSYLEHPWDKRMAVELTRETLAVLNDPRTSVSQEPGAAHVCPKSASEEDILAFWRENVETTWHMSSTCKMGRSEEGDEACVDPEFRVFGISGLRVADLSVMPFVPTAHTQTWAYQIGMIASKKLIKEHHLDA